MSKVTNRWLEESENTKEIRKSFKNKNIQYFSAACVDVLNNQEHIFEIEGKSISWEKIEELITECHAKLYDIEDLLVSNDTTSWAYNAIDNADLIDLLDNRNFSLETFVNLEWFIL
jgi:hypothetical protein